MKFTNYIYIITAIVIIGFIIRALNSKNYQTIDGFAQGGTYHLVYNHPKNLTLTTNDIKELVEKHFDKINKSLSGYDSTSIISLINQGENPPLDSIFIECFTISKEIYNQTDGLFDISAAPLFDIWGFGFKNREKVTQEKIDSIKQFVGMDKLEIIYNPNNNMHYLQKKDARAKINFNAIAQGYTCDYIGKILEQLGINNYLIEVGGEILCKGLNKYGKEWTIGIDKPLDGNFIPGQEFESIISVSNKGVVTSGNYRKFYIEDGEKISHTINPITGYPVKHNLLCATVIAETSAIADAYATYFMVLGLDKSKEFLIKKSNFDALLVYGEQDKMKVFSTAGIKQKKSN